jgi:hypothetical protein
VHAGVRRLQLRHGLAKGTSNPELIPPPTPLPATTAIFPHLERGFELVHEYTDRMSGAKTKRSAVDQMMGAAIAANSML